MGALWPNAAASNATILVCAKRLKKARACTCHTLHNVATGSRDDLFPVVSLGGWTLIFALPWEVWVRDESLITASAWRCCLNHDKTKALQECKRSFHYTINLLSKAKSSLGRLALQHGGQYKSYYSVEKSKCHKISPLNAFPLKFLASARFLLIV